MKNKELGDFGEQFVAKNVPCPKCKRPKTLRCLPTNFKCADLICDFCGYLAQVKTTQSKSASLPKALLGGAWGPQSERMKSGIYFPLFVVLVNEGSVSQIYFLPSDLQTEGMFRPRKPLSKDAKRAGWQGFLIDTHSVAERFHKIEIKEKKS